MNAGRLISIVLILGSGAAGAERLTYVYGHVLDPSGAAIPAAGVTVVNEENGFRRVTQSQDGGEYAVGSLEAGTYKITVRKDGFGAMIRFNVRLDPARPARADFMLAVGALQETVTVEGTAPLLSERESAIGARVYRDEIERLPLNGRGLLALVDLTPGVNVIPATRGDAGQFTFDGQRPNANFFTVDGVGANVGVSAGGVPAQVTGSALPAVTAFGSLDSLLPLEGIDEFRVKTAETAPESARLPGAIVALTSRSGSDEFHGSVAYRFRHELTAANDWFANVTGAGRAPLRMQDAAPSMGGPIRRNRAFFFAAYEHMTLRGPYVWQQAVPSRTIRDAAPEWIQPAISLFPEPNGPEMGDATARWSGRNVRPSALNSGMLRIDQALTSRVALFGRYNDAPSSSEFGSVQVNRLDLRFRSLTLGLNARLSQAVTFDFRANESQSSGRSTWLRAGEAAPSGCALEALKAHYAVDCGYLVRLVVGGMGQTAAGREGERRQRQFESMASVGITAGIHTVRLGLDFRRITAIRRDPGGTLSLIANDASELVNTGALWYATSPALNNGMAVVEVSGWLQDYWQAGPRLTLTPAVRWQIDPPPVPRDPVYFFFPPAGTFMSFRQPLWPRRSGVPAPRLGLAYRLDRDGATVLRAGAGLSYDSGLSVATDFINSGPLGGAEYRSAVQAPFSTVLNYGFMPDLRPPRIVHWNLSLDRAFGDRNVASIGYIGSIGRSLIRRELGGEGRTPTALMAVTTNRGWSKYEGLHVQYRRRLSRGLDAIASYAWSHSIDNDSSDAFLMWAGPGTGGRGERGSSDFDLRHSFTAAFSYEFPRRPAGSLRWLGGWAIDGMVRARTGFPMTVLESEQYLGIALANAFRPDLAWDQPVWLADAAAPGGKRLNPAAFRAVAPGVQGTLGRNAITGFGMSQADLAVRREFRLSDRHSIQFRVEAFNAPNRPSFADPVKFLSSALFGRSPSMLNLMLGTGSPGSGLAPLLQTGGSRSVQAAMRLRF
jgi:hypothetical protein